ncbi:MAG: hypothetical protein EOP47_20075 [Sphingobacteriaceae bacterium]|nr:MAG: hypothetical protein EOP47_20075 [Sphingobacteriaceae bacterium]
MIKISVGLLGSIVFGASTFISCASEKKQQDFTVVDTIMTVSDSVVKNKLADTDILINALTLSKNYIDNEVKADKQYKGKVLVVTGVIQEISKGIAGDIYVIFVGANKQRTILCQFNHEDVAATLNKNDIISLRGRCDGLMGSVLMSNCEIDTRATLN